MSVCRTVTGTAADDLGNEGEERISIEEEGKAGGGGKAGEGGTAAEREGVAGGEGNLGD